MLLVYFNIDYFSKSDLTLSGLVNTSKIMAALVFSGHDTFHCRQFWLKKALDFVAGGGQFNADDASLKLGVGKNMVTAIRYWARVFEIIDDGDRPTDLAFDLLSNDGWDPYLEDSGSLWLLHYHLLSNTIGADLFKIIFNEFARQRPEFRVDNVINFIEQNKQGGLNENTLKKDFTVFSRTYHADFSNKDIEESFTGILTELGLLKEISKTVVEPDGSIRKTNVWLIDREARNEVPAEILLYVILCEYPDSKSIALEQLYEYPNSPGSVFCLSKEGLALALQDLASKWPDRITFSTEAGIRELQIKKTFDKKKLIASYYGR